MNDADFAYRQLLIRLLNQGSRIEARNGPCRRLFAEKITFSHTPLVSLRRVAWRTALHEMEFFLGGGIHLTEAHPSVVPWWKPWASEHGSLQFSYGEQLRMMTCADPDTGFVGQFDQIDCMLRLLRDEPTSRRNCITTWYTPEMAHPDCSLPNCHGTVIQWFVEPDNRAHLVMYQRSADVICGLPHNWLQYHALLLWACHRSGRIPGTFNWIGGDVHLYDTHTDLARKVVAQQPTAKVPELVYRPTSEDFLADDFSLDGEYHPALEDRAEMVV